MRNVLADLALDASPRDVRKLAAREAELASVAGADQSLGLEVLALQRTMDEPQSLEAGARFVVDRLALAPQAAVLLRAGNEVVAATILRSRLRDVRGLAFGTLPTDSSFDVLVDRAWPG